MGTILLVLNTALGALAATGTVPAVVATLVAALSPIIADAISRIQSGQGKVSDVVTALGAMNAIIEAVRKQTNVDPKVLEAVEVYSTAVQMGMNEYLDSKSGVDLTKLTPVAPIA